jgi:hypothetical protein
MITEQQIEDMKAKGYTNEQITDEIEMDLNADIFEGGI